MLWRYDEKVKSRSKSRLFEIPLRMCMEIFLTIPDMVN